MLQRCGYTTKDLDLLVMHQANLRINEKAQQILGLPDDKVYNNIQKYGNTTSATLPLAFHEARQLGNGAGRLPGRLRRPRRRPPLGRGVDAGVISTGKGDVMESRRRNRIGISLVMCVIALMFFWRTPGAETVRWVQILLLFAAGMCGGLALAGVIERVRHEPMIS